MFVLSASVKVVVEEEEEEELEEEELFSSALSSEDSCTISPSTVGSVKAIASIPSSTDGTVNSNSTISSAPGSRKDFVET